MSQLKRCFALLIVALLLSASGCAATSTRESTGEYVDDAVITTRVKTAIFSEPSLKVFQISVETTRNVVQLSGHVPSAADMAKAVEVARAVPGVTSVKNDLQLR